MCKGRKSIEMPWTKEYGDVKCEKSEWTAPPHCKEVDLPQKETFEVTGRGGSTVYAWANVREATYIRQ